MGQTTRSVVEGNISVGEELLIAFWALVVCVLQFWLGKYIGGRHDNRISGGQALGQKKYGTCNMDGIHLFESGIGDSSWELCGVAEHHQQLSVVEKEKK
mgnify:FL=1